ncbi:hypothetical protein [Actinophytocola gossypii]|uniref:DUF2254 domain-containing protein n=1 Tax=Actinophytocola gossypii TaxID=2812003 RepID=A0ABT2JBX6_9PSEU|nr:hypothetical protein [Actinophytocola gossypii]MCT2585367.1 hypothetical protein [Actinophytocola gossypii]
MTKNVPVELSPEEEESLSKQREKWSQRRAALVMFVAAPALISLVGGVAVLPEHLQLVAIRAALLLVVCLLPSILWYLFISTRRVSLLNEFLANLDRLGLMREQPGEGEVTRRRRISGYLQRFGAVYGDLPEVVHRTVQEDRFERYTRAHFSGATGVTTAAIPVLASTALISIGWLLTLPPVDVSTDRAATEVVAWIEALTPTVQPITLAFLGAYFFSIQMLFRRYALKDLRGSAYISVSMRIVLAIIGVWVLTAVNERLGLLGGGTLYAVAFAVGVFPLVLWQIISHHLKKLRFLTVPSMRAALPLDQLDGLSVWHQVRLEEEDIENVPNMATADLVDLLLNTRLAPNRIIDWADQAILHTQLGPDAADKRAQLHARGVRNATTFLQVAATGAPLFDDETHRKLVPALEVGLRSNANLQLIECWRRICEHARPPVPQEVVLPVPVGGERDQAPAR